MGKCSILTPRASCIALATAAIGGTNDTSPTPRTPRGWPGLATSTMTVSIIGRSKLVERAAKIWDVSADDVEYQDGLLSHKSDP